MTPLPLLSIIVNQFLDVGLGEADLGEDLVGGGGPDERFGAGVVEGSSGLAPRFVLRQTDGMDTARSVKIIMVTVSR